MPVSKKVGFVVLAALLFVACAGLPAALQGCAGARSPADASEADFPDPATVQNPDCARACRKIRDWQCPEASHPDGGDGCYALCERKEHGGHFTLMPACVAAQDSPHSARNRCQRSDGSPALRCAGR